MPDNSTGGGASASAPVFPFQLVQTKPHTPPKARLFGASPGPSNLIYLSRYQDRPRPGRHCSAAAFAPRAPPGLAFVAYATSRPLAHGLAETCGAASFPQNSSRASSKSEGAGSQIALEPFRGSSAISARRGAFAVDVSLEAEGADAAGEGYAARRARVYSRQWMDRRLDGAKIDDLT